MSKYAALAGGVACFVDVFSRRYDWAGEWQDSVVEVAGATTLMLPLVAFAAAVDGRRLMGRGQGTWLTISGRARSRTAVLVLAAWMPSAVSVLLVYLAVVGYDAGVSHVRWPGTAALLVPYAWLLLLTCCGLAAARVLPMVAVAPLCLLLGFVVPVALAGRPGSTRALFTPLDDASVRVPFFLRSTVVSLQVTVVVLAALLIVVTMLLPRGVGNPVLRTGVLLALTATTAGLVVAGPDRDYLAEDATGPKECRTADSIRVCVWSDHRALLTPAVRAWEKLGPALPPGAVALEGLVESGLRVPAGGTSFSAGTSHVSEEELAQQFASRLVEREFCPSAEVLLPSDAVTQRETWLLARAGIISGADAAAWLDRRILAEPVHEQVAWWRGDDPAVEMSCVPEP